MARELDYAGLDKFPLLRPGAMVFYSSEQERKWIEKYSKETRVMADLRQVRTRLATAHTALTAAASILQELAYTDAGGTSEDEYMQREFHKILGRLEALDAGLAHRVPDKRRAHKHSSTEVSDT